MTQSQSLGSWEGMSREVNLTKRSVGERSRATVPYLSRLRFFPWGASSASVDLEYFVVVEATTAGENKVVIDCWSW